MAYGPRILQVLRSLLWGSQLRELTTTVYSGHHDGAQRLFPLQARQHVFRPTRSQVGAFVPPLLVVHLLHHGPTIFEFGGDSLYHGGVSVLALGLLGTSEASVNDCFVLTCTCRKMQLVRRPTPIRLLRRSTRIEF